MNLETYKNYIIDASAIIAFFYKENGWEVAAKYMPRSIMSAVNLSETVKILLECQEMPKEQSLVYINKAVEKIVSFDESQACIAGELYLKTKSLGLSLGDRSCLALALHTGYPVITADKAWQSLDIGINIILIR